MTQHGFEVTYRNGKPLAAYYCARRGASIERCEERDPGLVVDLGADGQPLGIEITAPSLLTLDRFNQVLEEFGLARISRAEFAPLHAA